jgi:hypothetical protein
MSREACLELARTLGIDPELLVEQWAERAAIREFEGGQPRADAERDALDDVRAAHRRGPKSAASIADPDVKKRVL